MDMNNIRILPEWQPDVELVKRHLKQKLWRAVPEQHNKWINFLTELSQLHGKEVPKLIVGKENYPRYNYLTKTIYLNKYSVVSLLHEFSHHVYGKSEKKAILYSTSIFLTAYKPARNKCYFDGNGWLKKKEEG